MAPKGYLPRRRRIELEAGDGGGGSEAKAKDASDFNEKKNFDHQQANCKNFPVIWFSG